MVCKTWHGSGRLTSAALQLAGARAALVPLVGAYAWMLPDQDLAAQIDAWCDPTADRGDLPLVIDFEEPGVMARGASLLARLEYAIERVSDRLGQRPIIYTGEWYWRGYLGNLDSPIAASCPLWLAAYPRKATTGTRYRQAVAEVCGGKLPAVPRPWSDRGLTPVLWQFDGDHGLTLPGGADVDVNTAAWSELLALGGRTLPDPHDAPTWPGRPVPVEIPAAVDFVRTLADPEDTKPA